MTELKWKGNRKSYMEVGEIYFWTASIHKFQHLLLTNEFKEIIIHSLNYLSINELVKVYAFVIMPNHIHLIWSIQAMNSKESPQGSFLKYTAHLFKKKILATDPEQLNQFSVNASNKIFEFWQRDPLAICLDTKEIAYQKLDYIHFNPILPPWNLATDPCNYWYSSASFYEKNSKNFDFLKDLRNEY